MTDLTLENWKDRLEKLIPRMQDYDDLEREPLIEFIDRLLSLKDQQHTAEIEEKENFIVTNIEHIRDIDGLSQKSYSSLRELVRQAFNNDDSPSPSRRKDI